MNLIKRLILSASILSVSLLFIPQTTLAYNFFGGVDCSKAASSTVCQTNNQQISGSGGVILKVTNIIAYIAGAAAIIVIVVAAMRFITSGSDTSVGSRIDDDVLNAKRSLSTAIVGLVIIILGKLLITYLVEKLQHG